MQLTTSQEQSFQKWPQTGVPLKRALFCKAWAWQGIGSNGCSYDLPDLRSLRSASTSVIYAVKITVKMKAAQKSSRCVST